MNYQIILDEQKFRDFIDWLPDLEDNELFYCSLFARKKYCQQLIKSNDKSQLRRFLSAKEDLYAKVRQLEVAVGAYHLREHIAPQEALVLYINPNPRNLIRASYDGIIKLTEMLKYQHQNFNPQAEMLSCIQRSQSRKLYLDFDIDDKDFNLRKLERHINLDAVDVLETRGGYHILVRLDAVAPEYEKTFYRAILALGVDQAGDQLLPVAGCTQGGFMPRFVELS